ncbi:hypothetical protein [Streptomyces sp. NPDC018055]|uniref:hypothetical protein n=1 Tax=Streptomyces sp. NPDC018055 TaxID=3365038 RepID=UPI0037A75661
MTTTRKYGTWNNHGDEWNLTVGSSIVTALNGAPSDWQERMDSSGALDRIKSDYRDAINDALPDGVSLSGNEFIGPAYAEDYTWEGELDISATVKGVDLWKIIERHDVDRVSSGESEA